MFKSVFVVINPTKGRPQTGYVVAKVRPVLMILTILKAPFLFCSGNKGVIVLFGSVTTRFKPLPLGCQGDEDQEGMEKQGERLSLGVQS